MANTPILFEWGGVEAGGERHAAARHGRADNLHYTYLYKAHHWEAHDSQREAFDKARRQAKKRG